MNGMAKNPQDYFAILNGKVPVTEDELRFLVKNHEKYDLTRLDVSQITNFSRLFYAEKIFNQDISGWNVSNGIHFYFMFSEATCFNQPIGKWDVSKGTDFNFMFSNATSFNQDLSSWNMSSEANFTGMFQLARSFNQPMCNWKVDEESLVDIVRSNFNLSVQYSFEKIGFTDNVDQLSLLFKDSPNSPFPKSFNYNAKKLYLIKTRRFYGFMDESNNAYQIDIKKTTLEDLIDICDIKITKEL